MNLDGFTKTDSGKLNVPRIGIGMLGYGFMGKTHTNVYKKISYMTWDLEDLNHLYVNLVNGPTGEISGFTKVNVTDPVHPFSDMLWPPGHNMGWKPEHVNEMLHFVDSVANDGINHIPLIYL